MSGSRFIYVVVGFAVIGAVLFGLDQGNWAGAIEKDGFVQKFCIEKGGDPDACYDPTLHPQWFTNFLSAGSSFLQLGAAFAAFFVAPSITSRFGRREAMLIGSCVAITGMLAMILTVQILLFLCARLVLGVGIGIVTYSLPMFIAEISPPEIRGMLGSLFQLMCMVGVLLASLIEAIPSVGYQVSFSLPIYPAIIVVAGIMCFPASPRFALMKWQRKGSPEKGVEHARASLRRLRGSEADVEDEVNKIRESLASEEEEAAWQVLWRDRSIRKRVLIANMLQWLQQFTGVNAILSYGPAILKSAGVPLSPFLCAITYNVFGLVFTVVMVLIIDRLGRRTLLLASTVGAFLFMAAAGIIAFVLDMDMIESDFSRISLGWALLACICGYMSSFGMGWGGVAWVYPSEIFPMDVKEKALSTSVCSQWLANFAIAYLVPQQVEVMKPFGTFFFYAVCLAMSFILVYWLVPETKGLAIEDMDTAFGPRQLETKQKKQLNLAVDQPRTTYSV